MTREAEVRLWLDAFVPTGICDLVLEYALYGNISDSFRIGGGSVRSAAIWTLSFSILPMHTSDALEEARLSVEEHGNPVEIAQFDTEEVLEELTTCIESFEDEGKALAVLELLQDARTAMGFRYAYSGFCERVEGCVFLIGGHLLEKDLTNEEW